MRCGVTVDAELSKELSKAKKIPAWLSDCCNPGLNLLCVRAGLVCTSCPEPSEAALSDRSACVACGASTGGLEDGGTECSCPVGEHANFNLNIHSWLWEGVCIILPRNMLHRDILLVSFRRGVEHLAELGRRRPGDWCDTARPGAP